MTPEAKALAVLCAIAWTGVLSFLIAPAVFDRLGRKGRLLTRRRRPLRHRTRLRPHGQPDEVREAQQNPVIANAPGGDSEGVLTD